MKKHTALFILMIAVHSLSAQLLIDSIPFPTLNVNFWGLGEKGDTLLLGDDFNGPISLMTKDGAIHRTINTPYTFNHGTVWTGTHYLVAEDFTNSGASLFELDELGMETNSWVFPIVLGGNSSGIGGLHYDNGDIWYTMYFPDFNIYPFSYAYRWTPGQLMASDTIPLRGEQPYGIALKGDTVLYVTDNLNGDVEKIYAYHASINDTLFSFDLPDTPIDNDMSPRGLHYDGKHLWLMANRQGGSAFSYRTLYKYGIAPYALMDIDPQEIHFQEVGVGTSSDMNFTISNSGEGDLLISSIEGTLPDFEISTPTFPQTISGGSELIVGIRFTPQNVGFQSTEFTVHSNDIISETQLVVATGIGAITPGIEDISDSHFSMYPNPAQNQLQINLIKPVSNQSITFEIVNLIGEIVQRQPLTQQESIVQLNDIPSGFYLVRLSENNQWMASKKLQIIHE